MCHTFQAAAVLVSLSVAQDIFQVTVLPTDMTFVTDVPARSV